MLGTFALLALMALGARVSEVRRMVLREGLKMAGLGAAFGFVLALPLPRIFAALFHDLPAGDPRVYVIVLVALLAVAMLATYIPARRASRIDPISALHSE